MATARKRGKAWQLRYIDERGVRVAVTVSARNKTEANRLADELERKAERVRLGLEVTAVQISFAELWERYRPIAQQKRSWTTIDGRFRNHILPRLGAKLIHQVTAADVEFLISDALARGYSPQLCGHLRNHVSAIFTFAAKKLRVFRGENPGRAADRPRIPTVAPRFFSVDVTARILENVAPQWRALFATAAYTGLRKGELVGLKCKNVDLVRQLITVESSYDNTTKAARVRFVPIPDELLPIIRNQLAITLGRSPWLFPNPEGGMFTKDVKLVSLLKSSLRRAGVFEAYRHVCRTRGPKKACGAPAESLSTPERTQCPQCGRLREAVGIAPKALFKDLRSTFGTHLVEQTGDLRVAQRILGHADAKITERYAFARQGHLLAKANMVSFRSVPATSHTKTNAHQNNHTNTHDVRNKTHMVTPVGVENDNANTDNHTITDATPTKPTE